LVALQSLVQLNLKRELAKSSFKFSRNLMVLVTHTAVVTVVINQHHQGPVEFTAKRVGTVQQKILTCKHKN
jgi:lipopolysaccharide/colanic/teichoic acid biosynthesis glycosyltransferase